MSLIFLFLLILSSFAALIAQIFIPPIQWLHGAQVQLLPIVMFYGVLALPYPGAMILTFFCGLMWDFYAVEVVGSSVELSLGWSILIYSLLGSMMHGFRPLFLKGRWEIFSLMTGIFTSATLFIEYLAVIFKRQSTTFPPSVWWYCLGGGLVAILLSPIFYWLFGRLAALVRYEADAPFFEEII